MTLDSPSAPLSAVTRRQFHLSASLWRSLAYAVGTALASGVLWTLLACPLAPVAIAAGKLRHGTEDLVTAVPLGLIGIVLLALIGPPLAVGVGYVERWRLRLVDDRPARDGRSGRNLYLDPATWRAFAYLLVLAVIAPLWLGAVMIAGLLVGALIAAPLAIRLDPGAFVIGTTTVDSMGQAIGLSLVGLVAAAILVYLTAAFSLAQAALARALLTVEAGSAEAQLVEVTASRARLADAFDAELHRIERNLHDGAQQRLVSLTMQLGLAKLDLPPGSPAAVAVDSAHEQAKAVMVELRDLVRGISPRTLTELGLPAAIDELAAAGPLSVTVRVSAARLPAPVETTAYFAISEALANVAKHSCTTRASVTVAQNAGMLTVEIRDDGRGGADPAGGSGITGLADRVAAVGGRLLLSSPVGGPTIVRIELPCAS
ncbi:signal transduction histidine kinase [Allocatelliglobosispora scoriae]|uniref:histidine kinase n=1 Tax=Allocatelliglobosispora scoriae TaxID=643052 RepID=A0A841C333_9ACTN|nr:sensor domain-containing protein [Allocatelliglobosispora scoriae]MBB5873543.1 signal transduction histidine kinase [Allocatelliglobosispora scoriae]